MTEKDIDTCRKVENEIIDLFDYIRDNYPSLLAFGAQSTYKRFIINSWYITIIYRGYEYNELNSIDFSIYDITSGSYEWLKDYIVLHGRNV